MKTMGIDLGIRKIAFSYWNNDQLIFTEAHESRAAHRTRQLYELSTFAVGGMSAFRPNSVFIEDTLVGNNVKYSLGLTEVKGAVLAAFGVIHYDKVILVNNKTWKKEVLGNGNATKDMVRHYLDERDSAYSGLCGNDQDRYDAACIGLYGYILGKRAEGLSLVDTR